MTIEKIMTIIRELAANNIRYSLDFTGQSQKFFLFITCRTPELFQTAYDIASIIDYSSVSGKEDEFTLECENGCIKFEKWWVA